MNIKEIKHDLTTICPQLATQEGCHDGTICADCIAACLDTMGYHKDQDEPEKLVDITKGQIIDKLILRNKKPTYEPASPEDSNTLLFDNKAGECRYVNEVYEFTWEDIVLMAGRIQRALEQELKGGNTNAKRKK